MRIDWAPEALACRASSAENEWIQNKDQRLGSKNEEPFKIVLKSLKKAQT